MTLTAVQAITTQTGAFAGTPIDISGITGNWTLKLQVAALSDSGSATPVCRFAFEDSVNSFTASLAGPTVSFQGALTNVADRVTSFKQQDFPDLRTGVSGALLRLHLTNLENTGSVTYHAWLEY